MNVYAAAALNDTTGVADLIDVLVDVDGLATWLATLSAPPTREQLRDFIVGRHPDRAAVTVRQTVTGGQALCVEVAASAGGGSLAVGERVS